MQKACEVPSWPFTQSLWPPIASALRFKARLTALRGCVCSDFYSSISCLRVSVEWSWSQARHGSRCYLSSCMAVLSRPLHVVSIIRHLVHTSTLHCPHQLLHRSAWTLFLFVEEVESSDFRGAVVVGWVWTAVCRAAMHGCLKLPFFASIMCITCFLRLGHPVIIIALVTRSVVHAVHFLGTTEMHPLWFCALRWLCICTWA